MAPSLPALPAPRGQAGRLASALAHLRDQLRRRAEAVRDALIGSMTSRDPILEFMALPGGGFQMAMQSQQDSLRRIFMHGSRFAAIIPGDSAAELVIANGLTNFLNLYNFCIIGRLLLTWFPQRPQALEGPLSTLCDPYLNLFRGLIPPLGGIDFSPILAFVILNTLTSTAAALPAEIDKVTGRCKSPKLDKPWEVHRWAAHTAAERKALKDKLKAREGR